MASIPHGFSTIGPIYESTKVKEKFIDVCKKESKTMETKLKELIKDSIRGVFPEFEFPTEG
jgi:hypothetical protein